MKFPKCTREGMSSHFASGKAPARRKVSGRSYQAAIQQCEDLRSALRRIQVAVDYVLAAGEARVQIAPDIRANLRTISVDTTDLLSKV